MLRIPAAPRPIPSSGIGTAVAALRYRIETVQVSEWTESGMSHNHRLSRWLAQPYKGMLLARLKAHRTKKQQLQNCAASTNVELCFNDITILRYALSGIVVFQSKTTPTMLNFYVITYLTFCFLFNGKSLFGTTRLAGGFRMPTKSGALPTDCAPVKYGFVRNKPL